MSAVLIVDDDPVHAEIAEMVLTGAGLSVRRAADGPLALEALAADPLPDLVLLDVMLPRLDGFEVLRRIRADGRTKGLPVIMVTSFTRDQDAARGRALGANDYIVKPLMHADFLRRVRAALKLNPSGS